MDFFLQVRGHRALLHHQNTHPVHQFYRVIYIHGDLGLRMQLKASPFYATLAAGIINDDSE